MANSPCSRRSGRGCLPGRIFTSRLAGGYPAAGRLRCFLLGNELLQSSQIGVCQLRSLTTRHSWAVFPQQASFRIRRLRSPVSVSTSAAAVPWGARCPPPPWMLARSTTSPGDEYLPSMGPSSTEQTTPPQIHLSATAVGSTPLQLL